MSDIQFYAKKVSCFDLPRDLFKMLYRHFGIKDFTTNKISKLEGFSMRTQTRFRAISDCPPPSS